MLCIKIKLESFGFFFRRPPFFLVLSPLLFVHCLRLAVSCFLQFQTAAFLILILIPLLFLVSLQQSCSLRGFQELLYILVEIICNIFV